MKGNEEMQDMWNYVRIEDFEDNGNIDKWAITKSRRYLMMIHLELDYMYGNKHDIHIVPAQNPDDVFPDSPKMYWIEHRTTYDEIEYVELLGFAYRNATNKEMVDAFRASVTK